MLIYLWETVIMGALGVVKTLLAATLVLAGIGAKSSEVNGKDCSGGDSCDRGLELFGAGDDRFGNDNVPTITSSSSQLSRRESRGRATTDQAGSVKYAVDQNSVVEQIKKKFASHGMKGLGDLALKPGNSFWNGVHSKIEVAPGLNLYNVKIIKGKLVEAYIKDLPITYRDSPGKNLTFDGTMNQDLLPVDGVIRDATGSIIFDGEISSNGPVVGRATNMTWEISGFTISFTGEIKRGKLDQGECTIAEGKNNPKSLKITNPTIATYDILFDNTDSKIVFSGLIDAVKKIPIFGNAKHSGKTVFKGMFKNSIPWSGRAENYMVERKVWYSGTLADGKPVNGVAVKADGWRTAYKDGRVIRVYHEPIK